MSDVTSPASWDYGIAEASESAHAGDESRVATGIATGIVLAIPCWMIIGWIIYSLWT